MSFEENADGIYNIKWNNKSFEIKHI
jgi:hypothetical protein